MRLTQLRSFHAVATAGSFTRAAEALHVSQPTVTTQVGQLEALYKVELFHRTGRRVRPTALGERLLQISRQIFSLEAEAVQLLGDAGELRSGHLRVAAVGPHHVTKMLVAFNQRYPGIKVQVERSGSERIYQRLGQERPHGSEEHHQRRHYRKLHPMHHDPPRAASHPCTPKLPPR